MRIDQILTKRYPSFSRNYFQRLIEASHVELNGQVVKKRIKPEAGDLVELALIEPEEVSAAPEAIPLDILYEDDFMIAINKPPGMVVHPAPGSWNGTFVNALVHHCKNLQDWEGLRPGIVHRLDKDTSGVLIAAKTREAHQKLVEAFSSRNMEKSYLTLTIGNPGNRTINEPIGRHPVRRKEMKVRHDGGKEAISICETLQSNNKLSLVRIKLITGRTHQIRVHLRHINTPILGDNLYGAKQLNEKWGVSRQMLHAATLKMLHPITEKELFLEAPLPEDMEKWVNNSNFSM